MNHLPNPAFDLIANGLQLELRDPVITEMLKSAQDAENALNSGNGNRKDSAKAEVIGILNSELRAHGLYGAIAYLSGKIRLSDGSSADYDTDYIPKEIEAFGSSFEDEDGTYYLVSRHSVVVGNFDIVSIDEPLDDGSVRTTHKIYQQFNTHQDEDPTEGAYYCYPSELDMYEPSEPSFAKMRQEIFENYPEIAEQIMQLPEACGDDEQIFDALKNFSLVIDWSQHPSLDDEDRGEILEYVEHAITEHIGLDDDIYELSVQGSVYTMTINKDVISRDLEDLTDIRGMIGNIRLVAASRDGERVSYHSDIEFAISTGERRGSRHLIYVPVSAIAAMRNLRNDPVFGIDAIELDDGVEVEIEPVRFNESSEAATDSEEVYSSREEELSEYEEAFRNMLHYCAEAMALTFESQEEVEEVRKALFEYLNIFSQLSPSPKPEFEMYGPGVIALQSTRTVNEDEEGAVVIRYSDLHLEDVGLFAKRGIIVNYTIETGRRVKDGADATEDTDTDDDSTGYGVSVRLIMKDTEPDSSLSVAKDEGSNINYYVLHNEKLFHAFADPENVTASIPELERIREAKRLIHSIETELPDLTHVPRRLRELFQMINDSDPDNFRDVSDIDLINSIGYDVGGDEVATEKVVDILAEIIIDKPVVVSGEMYTEKGVLIQQRISGIVADVTGNVDIVSTGEPMFKIVSADESVHFVPLSKIESMRI